MFKSQAELFGDTWVERKREAQQLDELQRRDIVTIVSVGGSRQTAAKHVGCTVRTINETARDDAAFDRKLRQAESQHELTQLQNLRTAAEKHWQASVWLLERKYPEVYGRRDPRQLTILQVGHLLAGLADIIVAEVPEAEYREKILSRLKELTAQLEVDSERQRLLDELD